MQELLLNYVDWLGWLVYLLIFLGMVAEGEVVLFSTMFLVRNEKLELYWVISILVLGVMVGDSLWYFLGMKLKRLKRFSRVFQKATFSLDELIQRRSGLVIIFTRFVYGIFRVTLLKMRGQGVSYQKFLQSEFLGAGLWVGTMGSLAYFFVGSTELIFPYVRYSEMALLGVLVLFLLISRLFSRYLTSQLVK